MSGEGFISRWSRRKIQARQGEGEGPAAQQPADNPAPPPAAANPPAEPAPLPPVESLTPESDFSPFMEPGVDPATRRLAVKKLFEDPRYNVMDGLDVYIDDYSKPDPLPEGWLEKMNQVARLGVFQPASPEGEEAADAPAGTPPESAIPQPESAVPALAEPAAGPAIPPVTSSDPTDVAQVPESRRDEA